jgi:uncharacterized protein YdaU (DUF1376 family)
VTNARQLLLKSKQQYEQSRQAKARAIAKGRPNNPRRARADYDRTGGSNKVNYYPFHLGDYAIDTTHLSNEEDLCYRRAIDLYMLQEGPLQDDEANAKRTLSRRLRVDEQTLQNVLNEFFTLTENGWEHTRCNAEIARFRAKSEKAKAAGTLGGKGRQANAKQTLSKRQAKAKLTNNQEPITNNQDRDADASPAKAAKPKRELKAQPIDDDYLAELQSKYPHAKVREQFANCTKWWLEKKKVHPSRRALVNWLDKVQPPPVASASIINSGLGDRCSVL